MNYSQPMTNVIVQFLKNKFSVGNPIQSRTLNGRHIKTKYHNVEYMLMYYSRKAEKSNMGKDQLCIDVIETRYLRLLIDYINVIVQIKYGIVTRQQMVYIIHSIRSQHNVIMQRERVNLQYIQDQRHYRWALPASTVGNP